MDAEPRTLDLIRELAHEYHHSGLIRDHADPNDKTGWNVRGIETCADALCVEAIAVIGEAEARADTGLDAAWKAALKMAFLDVEEGKSDETAEALADLYSRVVEIVGARR